MTYLTNTQRIERIAEASDMGALCQSLIDLIDALSPGHEAVDIAQTDLEIFRGNAVTEEANNAEYVTDLEEQIQELQKEVEKLQEELDELED